jgi:poly [ADP-ribose] polymerase
MDFETEKGIRFGGIPRWYHLDCFNQCRPDTNFWECGDKLPGFKKLSEEDQKSVKDKLPKMAA